MYTLEIEKECGCFKKSGYKNNQEFESKEELLMKARVVECLMNQQFCMTHLFEAVDYGDKIVIHSTIRPKDDLEDDDDIDVRELVAKSPVKIHITNGEEDIPYGGGCCGGGKCD